MRGLYRVAIRQNPALRVTEPGTHTPAAPLNNSAAPSGEAFFWGAGMRHSTSALHKEFPRGGQFTLDEQQAPPFAKFLPLLLKCDSQYGSQLLLSTCPGHTELSSKRFIQMNSFNETFNAVREGVATLPRGWGK